MRRFLLLALALSACSGAPDRLPDARLKTLGGPLGPSLAECATAKCLTVLVAPWCGVCHTVAPDIVRLRRHLDANGVSSRVVVGLDDAGPIAEFARVFGPDTLLDPERVLAGRGGVPMFVVTDRDGKILRRFNGFPSGAVSTAELAEYFGLL